MSADWAQGYVTDTIYTDNFFRELSPSWLNYVAALRGSLPIPLDRPFTYMELGCGLGRSTTVFAGAFPKATFIGVDFNPAHVALARRYAETIHVENVSFLERSFIDLPSSELPECDFIVLHGVYTWISAEARAGIRRIIRERLKPGGLVYVSYNSLPGWAAASPLRKLMLEISNQSKQDAANTVVPALDFMEELNGVNFAYLKSNPTTTETLKTLKTRGKNYLAHEFLNAEWALFYSVDIADEMADAKLTYLGSATLSENHLEYLVDKATADKINEQSSPRLRQLLQDYAVNQRFRRDIFVRGHPRLDGIERDVALGAIPLGTMLSDEEFTPKGRVGSREVTFAEKLLPIVKAAVLTGPKTINELRFACARATDRTANVDQMLVALVAAGHLTPFATAKNDSGSQKMNAINAAVMDVAIKTRARQQLICAQAGTGVAIDPVDALLASAQRGINKRPQDPEKALAKWFSENGLKLAKAGKALTAEAEAEEFAAELANRFKERKQPILSRLGI